MSAQRLTDKANQIAVTATGNLSSTNVQAALEELQADIDGVSAGSVADGDYGDITVSASGATWSIDAGAVTTTELGGDITAAGKALLDDASAAAQRTTLGLGTASTSNTGDFAAASHTHAASDVASGTIATGRLGSGTANSSTFLRGDQTWATPAASGGGGPDFLLMGG